MEVRINGKKFRVFDNDDDVTILERYSLKFANSSPSLPSYFRITNKDFVLENNLDLEVDDVRDVIGEMKQHDLSESSIILDILSKYPRLQKRTIGFLWIILHPKETVKIEYFKPLDRYSFSTLTKTKASVAEFQKEVAAINKKMAEDVKSENEIFQAINKIKPIPVELFSREEVSIESGVELENNENILDVFDAMTVSQEIPFIALVYKKKRFFKVFTQRSPPDSWIEPIRKESRQNDGIYFKILNMPPSKLSSKKILLENLYADGFWSTENNVYFTFKVRDEEAEDKIRNKIFNTLGNRLKFKIVSNRQIGIKGTFLVKNFTLERYIFADLICTNKLFKRFLYLDERGAGKDIKTVMTKDRLFFHYTASNRDGYSLSITVTPIIDQSGDSLSVRVAGAQNFQQANAVANTFSKLLALYLKEAAGIKKIYESIIPNFKAKKITVKKVKKEDKKTKKRLFALNAHDPKMFKSRYADQCQKQQQPVIITKEEADKVVKDFVDSGLSQLEATHKIMFFDGAYYVCDPREPEDKDQVHIWPGLKQNKHKSDAVYREQFPLLPCCYKVDQYKKKSGKLRLYMAEAEEEAAGGAKKERGAIEHILGPNKPVVLGRFGEMAFNWEKIFKYLGLKKVTKGKQKEFYPILRYGVAESPDSFVRCLERAFNPKYSSFKEDARSKKVMEVRKEIAEYVKEPERFNVAKQELYGYTNKSVVEILTDPDRYIDPDVFVSLFEKYYECNIFLYVLSSEFPNGGVVIPKFSQAYLARDIDDSKPFVLINKFETKEKDSPYQCELISSMNVQQGKVKNVEYKFPRTSAIAKIATQMFYDSNEVFIVSPDSCEPYKPVPEQ